MHAIAFLRGINLGGHTVKKEQLIDVFASVGCQNVTTFIASGNVVFDQPAGALAALEAKAEAAFAAALGYAAPTFIRTTADLRAVVAGRPFAGRGPETGGTLHVGFLKRKLTAAQANALAALQTDNDELHADGKVFYWHTHTERMSDSVLNPKKLEKALGQDTTLRSIKTIDNILAKWPD